MNEPMGDPDVERELREANARADAAARRRMAWEFPKAPGYLVSEYGSDGLLVGFEGGLASREAAEAVTPRVPGNTLYISRR